MTKNRKMILALSILASCVGLFFSSTVLAAQPLEPGPCSVPKGHLCHCCGYIDVPKGHLVTIKFHVSGASPFAPPPSPAPNEVCFGPVCDVWHALCKRCTFRNGPNHLTVAWEGRHQICLGSDVDGVGKVRIESIVKKKCFIC